MMKKVFILLVFICLMAGCDKHGTPVENNSLIGKWKLTESLADPGDGSGKWKPADPAHPSYLEFKTDGTLVFTPYNMYNADRYKILTDSTMLFYRSIGDSLLMRYQFLKTSLVIHPPCYEACGEKFIAVH